jgi:hypothetical protein
MRKFVLLLVVVAVVAGMWSGGWVFAAGEIRKAVASLAPDGTADESMTCGRLDIGGFPFRFDLSCTEATIVAGDLTVTVAGIRASILAYNPTQAVFSALAPVTVADAYSGVQNRIGFASAEGSARLITDDLWLGLTGKGWRVGRVSIAAENVDWTDITVAEARLLSAASAEAHLVDIAEQHDAAAGTSALAAYATLHEADAPGLGIGSGEMSVEAELTGLPDDIRALTETGVISRWQEAGGQFRLVALKGQAGEEFIESSGALGLDSGSRLDGQVTVRSRGLIERVGAVLPEDWKGLIVGGQAEDGSYSQTVTIRAGVVFSGIMPLAIIPPLN